MNAWPDSRSHVITRSPPLRETVTWSCVYPLSTEATALAVAPVPQAQVSPLPLSHTLMRIWSLSITWTNSEFTRPGKRLWFS